MQFYLNGYRAGNPEIRPAQPDAHPDRIPDQVDVLIVGSGPAGLVLAAQLAQFPDITTRLVERSDGPLQVGRADGVACRTVEMFDAFGLAEDLVREAYWVNETTFWGPDADNPERIVRTGHLQDVEEGLSEYPHVIVNQARMQDFLLQAAHNAPSRLVPDYGLVMESLQVDESLVGKPGEYPVTVQLRRADTPSGEEAAFNPAADQVTASAGHADQVPAEQTVRARYVVGCDGAGSSVRGSIGVQLRGDARNHAWGVLDVLAVSDFPDIRLKAAIQSATGGSVLLIPREGGYLIRLYVDLGDLDPNDPQARHRFTPEMIIETAQRIFQPYTLEVKDVAWWSVYAVGQRIADAFDDVPQAERGTRSPHVFIAGDACHTHSAKAGQGMNVSMQDTFNLGWKLAAVLQGRSPATLLDTYGAERHAIAQELIDFDYTWSTAMAAKPGTAEEGGMSAAERQEVFSAGGRFTAGFATQYPPNMIVGHDTHQFLAPGFPIGERFHSAPVVRLADAKPVHLGHEAKADGRWRLYIFADSTDPQSPESRLAKLCDFLQDSPDSPVVRHTPPGAAPDAVIEVKAILQHHHRTVEVDRMHEFLQPRKGELGLIDYEKIFCADMKQGLDIFDQRKVRRHNGAVVIVRPDQYVAHVLDVDDHTGIADFFAGFMLPGEQARVSAELAI